MYRPSQQFLDLIDNSLTFSPKSKIVVEGVEYSGEFYLKTWPRVEHCAEKFIGGFPAKTCSFEIWNRDGSIDLHGKEVEVHRGLVVGGAVEWIPMGLFTAAAEDITTSKTGGFITFTGTDRTKRFEKAYGGELDYPAPLGAFVQDICDRAGIPLETPDFPLHDMLLPDKPNISEEYLERDLIAQAAELGGCIAQITRTGGLRISRAEDTGRTIAPLHYKSLEMEPPYPAINSVALGHADYEDAVLLEDEEAIAANGKSEWLVADNPYVDLHRVELIPYVAAELFGLTVTPFRATDYLDFFIYDIGDLVTVTARDGTSIQTMVLQIKNTARIRSELSTPTQTGGKTNKAMAGGLRAAMQRVQLTVDHQNAVITALAEKVDGEGNDFTSLLEQSANEIMASVAAQYASGSYVETIMQMMNDGIDFRFTSTQERVDALVSEVGGNQSLLEEYIRFQGALIELGRVGNAFTAQLDNERLAFLENGNPIAYISNQTLWITDAQILNQLRLGKWIWMAQSNDNLILAWVGSE